MLSGWASFIPCSLSHQRTLRHLFASQSSYLLLIEGDLLNTSQNLIFDGNSCNGRLKTPQFQKTVFQNYYNLKEQGNLNTQQGVLGFEYIEIAINISNLIINLPLMQVLKHIPRLFLSFLLRVAMQQFQAYFQNIFHFLSQEKLSKNLQEKIKKTLTFYFFIDPSAFIYMIYLAKRFLQPKNSNNISPTLQWLLRKFVFRSSSIDNPLLLLILSKTQQKRSFPIHSFFTHHLFLSAAVLQGNQTLLLQFAYVLIFFHVTPHVIIEQDLYALNVSIEIST